MCHIMAEHLEPFILDFHIPHNNMVCPRLATISIFDATFPGEALVQVLQSCAPLLGTSLENRCLQSVKAWCCHLGNHHRVALEDISKACGGHLALNFQSFFCGSWCSCQANCKLDNL